jgi:hypothetical protein
MCGIEANEHYSPYKADNQFEKSISRLRITKSPALWLASAAKMHRK